MGHAVIAMVRLMVCGNNFFHGYESLLGALPSPKRLPAAQGFGRRGFAQAGETSVFRER